MCIDDKLKINNGIPVAAVTAPTDDDVPVLVACDKSPPAPTPPPDPVDVEIPPTKRQPRARPERIRVFRQPEWTQFHNREPEDDERICRRNRLASFLFRRSSRFVWEIP